MRVFFIFCFFIVSLQCQSQCLYAYTFQGAPGNIKFDNINVIPNEVYQFDFSTVNVPDQLVIYNKTDLSDSLVFIIGDMVLNSNPFLHLYRGYCEFEYDNGVLITQKLQSTIKPSDFSATNVNSDAGGMLRLTYKVNVGVCKLYFKISGNTQQNTVYDLCIKKIEDGFIEVSDTIYQVHCGEKSPTYLQQDCDNFLVIYEDVSIKDTPIVKYNGCVDGEISVEFPNYPQFNTTNLKLGNNKITVSNGVCEKDFDFYFSPSTLCEYYVPNVLLLDNKDNGQLKLYTKQDVQYQLFVYDRWGGLVWDGFCISNVSGWDGRQYGSNKAVETGVYTYVIKCLDKNLFGDITVLK